MAAFGDLLESPGEPEAKLETSEEAPLTAVPFPPFPPPPETEAVLPTLSEGAPAFEESTIQEGQPVAEDLPGTEFLAESSSVEEIETAVLQQPPIADILQPETPLPEHMVWTAEPAEVTAEDEKLFDQTSSDWEGLTKLVEAEDTGSSGGGFPWDRTEQTSAAAVLPEVEAPAAPPSSFRQTRRRPA